MENKSIFENINCNLCGSDDYRIKYYPSVTEYNVDNIFSASGSVMGTQQIVKCSKCGLIYVQPRVKDDIVTNAYRKSTDELYVSQADAREKTFKDYIRLVDSYVPKKGKILDVGAAAGFFLKAARDDGWDVHGTELSQWLSDYGNKRYNLDIKPGLLKDIHFPDSHFDAVTMWDVLEHTSDPSSELAEINRILKPGGVLIINYPDIGVPLSRLAGRKWWFLLSGHLYYFDRNSMKKILVKTGFEVIKSKMHFQGMELGHLAKMLALYSKPLSKIAQSAFSVLGVGNTQIKYYASQTNVISRKK
ncbi:MAG: class I SAM-dependent methyltransferase [Elusimicrobiota bacterium]